MKKRVLPSKTVFTSRLTNHVYGATIEVCARRKNTRGYIIFGYSGGVLLSVEVSPPPARKHFFEGIFDDMVKLAEEVVLSAYGARPRFSVSDCRTFF